MQDSLYPVQTEMWFEVDVLNLLFSKINGIGTISIKGVFSDMQKERAIRYTW